MADPKSLNHDDLLRNENTEKIESQYDSPKQDRCGGQNSSANENNGVRKGDQTEKRTEEAVEERPEKPSILKKLWEKVDLDTGTVLMMFK
jgi:hypothetical protein